MEFSQYSNEVKYGAAIGSASLLAGTIVGTKLSTGVQAATYSLGSNGATVVNVFTPKSTAPTAGTITGFWVIGAGARGSAVVFGTTAGTIAVFGYGSAVGTFTGTAVLNAAVVGGDTVTVYNTNDGSGTATFVVTFTTIT